MKKCNQAGGIDPLLLPLLGAVLLLIGALAFGTWAFGQRQDYKNNVDMKIQTAVTAAQKSEDAVKEKDFAQREKNPLKTYNGPSEYGSVVVMYPKTWSGYVADAGESSPHLDGYFDPGVVPNVQDETSIYALRLQVVDDSYSSILEGYANNGGESAVTIQPYSAPKVPQVVGSRVEGKITDTKTGTMVLFPLRDKTLKIWTESNQYASDFNNVILPNLTFSP